jgi:mRNA interferase MazF
MLNIKRGEIWSADLDPAAGSEQGGHRPVLIIQNDMGNHNSETTIVAPVTAAGRSGNIPTQVRMVAERLPLESTILLEQIRVIDKCRLDKYLGKADAETMVSVSKAIMISLGLDTDGGDERG